MKFIRKLLLSSLLIVPSLAMADGKDSCTIRLTAQLVQDILNAINIILPKIISIQITIDQININLSTCCATIISQLDIIERLVQISGIAGIVSNFDELQTCCDTINSKIGDLNLPGTCLDSIIDVPEDINNLNLTIIQLLKTILLELRGCSPC